KQPKRRETLLENADNARISKKLVTLDDKAPLPEGPEHFAVHEPEPTTLIAFLKSMEFAAITKRVATRFGIEDVDAIAAAGGPAAQPPALQEESVRPSAAVRDKDAVTVGAVAARAAILRAIDHNAYETVTSVK